jgi:DNA polymerase I-like protein with 3'-5' exonuclease and polymerase domains
MFDSLGDIFRSVGKIVGTIVGPIIGIPVHIIAETLGITKEMAQEAIDAGCESYGEVRDFFDLD